LNKFTDYRIENNKKNDSVKNLLDLNKKIERKKKDKKCINLSGKFIKSKFFGGENKPSEIIIKKTIKFKIQKMEKSSFLIKAKNRFFSINH